MANKYFYRKGGAEISFFETANLLKSRGHKIIFFSMQNDKNLNSVYEKYFVTNTDYEHGNLIKKINAIAKLLYSFEAKRKIESLIKDELPDIVHLNNIYHQISPSILHTIKKYHIPIVMSLRDYKLVCASYSMLANEKVCDACRNNRYYNCFLNKCVKQSRLKSFVNTLEMYLHHKILHMYDLVDIFISPSKFLKLKLEEMGFKGKIIYLPNFVKTEDYKPQYTWQENAIVYFGRLSKEKGLFTLIDAIKDLNRIVLKVIGEGPLKESLELKVESLKLNNVKFLGYKTGHKLHDEIRKSMFVVCPSEWNENNPRSIIESFALGKPVIGSSIGGINELIRDNETGLLFEPGSPYDLRSKIEYLIYNPDKIIEMGRNARLFVEKELQAERHYRELMNIYNQALNK